MAVSKKRSLSDMQDMQDIDRPSAKQSDDDTYRMMVLRFEETEDEVDRHFLQTALDLGINIPQDPETTLDLITNSISSLNINAEPSGPTLSPPSRAASQSTHTASDSSIEHPGHRKTPSLAATSITSASLSSVASHKSNIVKVRRGLRRISRFHRRKTVPDPVPNIPPRVSSILQIGRSGIKSQRAITLDQVPTISDPQPHAMTTDQPHTPQTPRTRGASVTHEPAPPPPPTAAPPPPPEESSLQSISGRRRSISNPILKNLRTVQLQEQLRFISFEASQKRLLRTKHLQRKRETLAQYHQQQKDTHTRHAESLTSLETRHLTGEAELHRTLQTERQACDTRLKHMQAYCNPRNVVEGMPNRVVTKADYRQLEQQYHIRNGMDNLHASRINVLREKQAKQVERIVAKQEVELDNLEIEFEHQTEELDAKFQEQESRLQEEFAERKRRLVSRWNIAEAIERRRLELQSGEEHGPLPVIAWSSDADSKCSAPSSPVSSRGFSPRELRRLSSRGSRGMSRDGYPQEADTTYDTSNVM